MVDFVVIGVEQFSERRTTFFFFEWTVILIDFIFLQYSIFVHSVRKVGFAEVGPSGGESRVEVCFFVLMDGDRGTFELGG